jgi:hypothetical protein
MHMMSIGTGIPGNPPWPEDSKFNSTINFDVLVPEHTPVGTRDVGKTEKLEKWNCQGVMGNGTLMEEVMWCEGDGDGQRKGGLMFGMQRYTELGEMRAELSFWLRLYRTE